MVYFLPPPPPPPLPLIFSSKKSEFTSSLSWYYTLFFHSFRWCGYDIILDFFLMGTRLKITKMAASLWRGNMALNCDISRTSWHMRSVVARSLGFFTVFHLSQLVLNPEFPFKKPLFKNESKPVSFRMRPFLC